jgi:DNA-binding transcriptional LysR family regulator
VKDWDDYRYFLAVAEAGSVSAAARALGASQPTVGRRIDELERRTNARLFHRGPSGCVLTELGEQIAERARIIEREARWIEQKVHYADTSAEGRVTLTTTEDMSFFCLTPLLGDFHRAHPEIDLDMIVTYQAMDLLSGEADIALRVGDPRSEQLVGRRVAGARFHLYASETYLQHHGVPYTIAELGQHHVIDSVRQLNAFPQVDWLRRNADGARVAFTGDNIMVQLSALQAGLGIMSLPSYMVRDRPDIRRLLPEEFELTLDVWLLTPKDLNKLPRVRAVLDFLAARLAPIIDERAA